MHAFIAISIPRRGYRPRDDILKTRASWDRKLDRRPRIRSSRSLINTMQSYSLHSRVHPPPFSSVSALLTFFFLPPRGVHVRIDKALDKERTAKFDIHDICNEWPDRWQVARNRFIGGRSTRGKAVSRR